MNVESKRIKHSFVVIRNVTQRNITGNKYGE